MKLLVLLLSAVAYVAYSAEPDCPAFGDWLPWTKDCLWFPVTEFRKGFADACQTTFNSSATAGSIPTPPGFQMPSKCGHCSFKLRCRKREKKEGCMSIDPQKEVCHEFGDVCTLTKHPLVGCKWGIFMGALRNCANRPDIPDWRRDAYRKFGEGLPDGNCIEKDGQCKCCCHPYRPNEEGTACVKEEEAQCEPFGKFNDWSQCMWFPLADIAKNIKEHCQLDVKGDIPSGLLPTPAGLQIPEKCGYCSFKARCRKRDRKDGCFHIDGEKKACGPDDCPTCGDVCTLPKAKDGSCDWGKSIGKTLFQKAEAFSGAMPYWKKRGIARLMRHIPYGKCKEAGDKCKCCCHPYEPNEDGTRCQLSQMCAIEPTH